VTDDRDWSWMHRPNPDAQPVVEGRLWVMVNGAQRSNIC
jgi:hypothetical protein